MNEIDEKLEKVKHLKGMVESVYQLMKLGRNNGCRHEYHPVHWIRDIEEQINAFRLEIAKLRDE
jgi:hypothetical protein